MSCRGRIGHFRDVRLERSQEGDYRRENGSFSAQNRLKNDVRKHAKIGHLACPNVLLTITLEEIVFVYEISIDCGIAEV